MIELVNGDTLKRFSSAKTLVAEPQAEWVEFILELVPGQGSPALGPGSSLQSVLCASSTGSKDSSGPSGSLGPRGNH